MRKNYFIGLLLLIMLLTLAGCSSTSDTPKYSLEVDPNAQVISDKFEEEVVSKTVAIPGWNSISIPTGYNEVYVDFYNPDVNVDMYNLEFEWRLLNDDGESYEVLYKSDLIAPGEHTEKIILSKSFEVGEYETVIFVQPYKISDNSPTNNANMNTKLIVR